MEAECGEERIKSVSLHYSVTLPYHQLATTTTVEQYSSSAKSTFTITPRSSPRAMLTILDHSPVKHSAQLCS